MDDQALIALTQNLLEAIVQGDYDTYDRLVADDLTCFEPEAPGTLVQGKAFHKYYFDLDRRIKNSSSMRNVTMSCPHVRRIGNDVAVVSYIRLNQIMETGQAHPLTTKSCETRVWQLGKDERWKNVHFHRS